MANHSTSATVSFLLAIIVIGISQVLKNDLATTKTGTLVAGALGSLIFVFLLTALSNLQMASIGEQVKSGLSEASICLVIALIVSASVHRVAITVCFMFSSFLLFILTGISQSRYATAVLQSLGQHRRKR